MGMAPHSSTLAWKIPWMEEPGRLQSMGLLRVGHNWATLLSLFTFMHWRRKWQPTPVFLLGESQGQGAWWAAVYGVAQSRTRLKWLSSSSSSSSLLRIWLRIWMNIQKEEMCRVWYVGRGTELPCPLRVLHSSSTSTCSPTCCCCCWVASVVSDSVRPHRQQPTRLPRPWDSPGKNTGVGCHFLLQCMKV